VRINDELPSTATNKILKQELISAGVTAQGGVLWHRPGRGRRYVSLAPADDHGVPADAAPATDMR